MTLRAILREALAQRLARGETRTFAKAEMRGLPMDEASRLARAREMGFDTETPLYHSTFSDVDRFDFEDVANLDIDTGAGVFTVARNPVESNFFVQRALDTMGGRADDFMSGANTMPLYGRIKNPMIFETQRDFRRAVEDAPYDRRGQGFALRNELEAQGYDGVVVRNSQMDGADGAEWRVIFDPSNIRSRFAAFAPHNTNRANLLGGFAIGAPIGALTLREALRERAGA